MTELEMVKLARTHLEKDHALALFMVRDLQVVKDVELNGLVWSMHENYCARSEVAWLLNELEAHLVKQARHCLTCRTPTDGAPLCDRCARQMRRGCKLVHLAITAGACVGSGTIRNLRRDEELLVRQTEWEAREAKLIPLPAGMATLRAEIYRFEEERGCTLAVVEVERSGFIAMRRLAGLAGVTAPVRLDAEARPGHAVLVGQRASG